MSSSKQKFKYGLVGVLFAVIAVYALFTAKDLIFGIKIKVNNLKQGEVVNDPLLKLSGIANHASELSINNNKVFLDRVGTFTDSLLLAPGYNIITVKAKDKFGKETEKSFQVVLKPSFVN